LHASRQRAKTPRFMLRRSRLPLFASYLRESRDICG
jgi:hypothetical protein